MTSQAINGYNICICGFEGMLNWDIEKIELDFVRNKREDRFEVCLVPLNNENLEKIIIF